MKQGYGILDPQEVVGIVFVDAVHMEAPIFSRIFRAISQGFSFLGCFGLLRLLFKFSPPMNANPQWTSAMQKTYTACHQAKTKTFATCLAEWDGYWVSFRDLNAKARSLKDISVTLISRDPEKPIRPGMSKDVMKKACVELEKMHHKQLDDSPPARFVIAKESNHSSYNQKVKRFTILFSSLKEWGAIGRIQHV